MKIRAQSEEPLTVITEDTLAYSARDVKRNETRTDWDAKRGMNRPLRVMVVGIPNVGKSTLINQISGRKGAKAENRPGVTRDQKWFVIDGGAQLLDTPGVLWPKFEDENVGYKLAFTGAIKDEIMDVEELAFYLLGFLRKNYLEMTDGLW